MFTVEKSYIKPSRHGRGKCLGFTVGSLPLEGRVREGVKMMF
jgi:hypothetical protein